MMLRIRRIFQFTCEEGVNSLIKGVLITESMSVAIQRRHV